jgi:hypothetical protein
MSIVRTGIDYASGDGDETVMVFIRYEGTISAIVAELRGEAAEYVAALEAQLEAMRELILEVASELEDWVPSEERRMLGDDQQQLYRILNQWADELRAAAQEEQRE